MKFSIIVVCLNPGTKLNQTLDSILAQTCPDFEVIVKDGGSRDGSIAVSYTHLDYHGDLDSLRCRTFCTGEAGDQSAVHE